MPVPTVMERKSRKSRPLPARCSPSVAAWASLISSTGLPISWATAGPAAIAVPFIGERNRKLDPSGGTVDHARDSQTNCLDRARVLHLAHRLADQPHGLLQQVRSRDARVGSERSRG